MLALVPCLLKKMSIMKTEKNFRSEKMLKFTQFYNF